MTLMGPSHLHSCKTCAESCFCLSHVCYSLSVDLLIMVSLGDTYCKLCHASRMELQHVSTEAYASIKQINNCWTVWHEMTDKHQRGGKDSTDSSHCVNSTNSQIFFLLGNVNPLKLGGLIPSDVALSCMLDAIVTSGQAGYLLNTASLRTLTGCI